VLMKWGYFGRGCLTETFISEEEEKAPAFKVSKDHFTLLLKGNVEGDTKLKPLLIYHSQNP